MPFPIAAEKQLHQEHEFSLVELHCSVCLGGSQFAKQAVHGL